MEKNKVAILTAICLILVGAIIVSSSSNGTKLSRTENQVIALSAVVAKKDAEVKKLSSMIKAKDQEIAGLKQDIEKVKTELSNTVVRLQASPSAAQ